jgi:hypothetical protein
MQLVEATAEMGAVRSRPNRDNLVGREQATFELELTATGQVLAVEAGALEPVAVAALEAEVPDGATLFPESIATTIGAPAFDDGRVTFEVSATGQGWRPPDAAALLDEVRGLSVAEAEAALDDHGEVVIDVWPFYVATIPDGDRATLTVVPPTSSTP